MVKSRIFDNTQLLKEHPELPHYKEAAELHVQHGLHAHNLGSGGHQRNPAQGLADHGDFREHFFKLVFHACLLYTSLPHSSDT